MALPATDAFNGSNGSTLAGRTGWTVYAGSCEVTTANDPAGSMRVNGLLTIAGWTDDVFGNDQYAEFVISADAGDEWFGPAVRATQGASGATFGDGYICRGDGAIKRFDDANGNTGETTLASGLTVVVVTDVLRAEANGTTITRKIDGATQGSVTDATYASGAAGVGGYSSSLEANNWEGGNLAAAGHPWHYYAQQQ
jgi:hypothetical protein